jgi:cation:H+ antiporter
MLTFVLFAIGFVFLVKGADFLIKGAISLARRYNISDIVIGLTIVSLGTSLPELIINLFASIKGSSSIAIGNIFGSNIANVLLILGLAAIFNPLPLKRNTIFSEIPFALIAALLVGFLANAAFTGTESSLFISRFDGIVMLLFFCLFILYVIKIAKEPSTVQTQNNNLLPISKSVLFISLGMVLLYFGGNWVVSGAIEISAIFGLSEELIGLTVVAIGTSLPELVTSVVAARNKNVDIAVGNVVGSNIFNLLWVLGLSAVIKPLPFDVINNVDILVMILSTTLIILSLALDKKNRINKVSGFIFVLLYFGYIYYLIVRG